MKAGEEPITETEWSDNESNRVRITKEFYLATLLEALASYDWTSQKKRARLIPMDNYEYEEVLSPKQSDIVKYYVYDSEDDKYYKAENYDPSETYYLQIEVNLTGYAFMYTLPADCAKVISVNDDKPYVVEGAFLFTDEENAILFYVRNYWTGRYEYEPVAAKQESDLDKYWIKNEDGTYSKATIWDPDPTVVYYVIVEHDYNFYDQPKLDPTLSAYFECKLAASLALKLTGGTDKYQLLYNEAQLIANNAMKKSAEQARNKTKGNEWWTTQLGLD